MPLPSSRPPDVHAVSTIRLISHDKGVVFDEVVFGQRFGAEKVDAELDQFFPLHEGEDVCGLLRVRKSGRANFDERTKIPKKLLRS